MNENAQRLIKEHLESLFFEQEQAFAHSQARKDLGWNIRQIRCRKIKSKQGVFNFKRYLFIDKQNQYHFYDNNPIWTIPKHKNIDLSIIENVVALKKEGMSNRAIKEIAYQNMICAKTITNILKSQTQQQKINFRQPTDSGRILYLEVDDTFLDLRNSSNTIKKNRVRVIVAHKGKNSNNEIVHKTVIVELALTKSGSGIDDAYIETIRSKIEEIYGNDFDQIIIYGDGASFIKTLAKALNAKYILDWFHIIHKLFSLCGFGKYKTENKKIFLDYLLTYEVSLFKTIKLLLLQGKWELALQILVYEFKNKWDKISKIKKKLLQDFIKYIKNNKDFIKDFEQEYHIGSHTEAFISHHIKKYGKKKFAVFGVDTFKTILLFNTKSNENLIFI
ncbi:Uncharacterised protein family (UPF0236) [Mycoplasmopsis citelli]|uniref:Transposase n=1 Tax=Mycoplasmopsis citelli TaxID=171281 RepID=A0A449B2M7_9BACT|nr:UPF0236 family protein [Mycoplasmopsis citelli]VEU74842.1 Uncharacterised protein family (UPF0236) [Mycoplasmopsis citelli]